MENTDSFHSFMGDSMYKAEKKVPTCSENQHYNKTMFFGPNSIKGESQK